MEEEVKENAARIFISKIQEEGGELNEEQIEAMKFYSSLNEENELTDEQKKFKLVCGIIKDQFQRAAGKIIYFNIKKIQKKMKKIQNE